MTDRLPVPVDVSAAGRALLAAVDGYLSEHRATPEPHELIILHAAARQADRLAQIRDALSGADFREGWAVRLAAEERQGAAALAALLITKLGLPTGLADVPSGTGSSPMSRRGSAGAAARWGNRGA